MNFSNWPMIEKSEAVILAKRQFSIRQVNPLSGDTGAGYPNALSLDENSSMIKIEQNENGGVRFAVSHLA